MNIPLLGGGGAGGRGGGSTEIKYIILLTTVMDMQGHVSVPTHMKVTSVGNGHTT